MFRCHHDIIFKWENNIKIDLTYTGWGDKKT